MAGEGLFHSFLSTLRGRVHASGSFTTANTDAPTSKTGDGVVARTDVGTYTVTLSKKFAKDSVICFVDNPTPSDKLAYKCNHSTSTGKSVLTIVVWDVSSGAAADTTGAIVNWMFDASGRST